MSSDIVWWMDTLFGSRFCVAVAVVKSCPDSEGRTLGRLGLRARLFTTLGRSLSRW